jgi:signal transduction histidine kinase
LSSIFVWFSRIGGRATGSASKVLVVGHDSVSLRMPRLNRRTVPIRSIPYIPRFLRCAALLCATVVLLCARAKAQAVATDAAVPVQPVVTSIQQFWNLTFEQKSRSCAFKIECDVTYFDPSWKILYVQDTNGDGAYVPFNTLNFPFKADERIVVAGQLFPPISDLSFNHAVFRPAGVSRIVPEPVAGGITQWEKFKSKFVTAEGFVDRYSRFDSDHLQITLSVEGQTVVVWVLISPETPVPNLENTIVRVEGVYNPRFGPDGKLSELDFMISGPDHLKVINRLRSDSRFNLPVVPIGSLPKLPADSVVHISGQVVAQEPGHFLRIRDRSGQVDVMTGQIRLCAIDETVEAVGYPVVGRTPWMLRFGLFRTVETPSPATASLPPAGTLGLTAQVLELAPEDAARGRPVGLTGIVTWSHKNEPFFFIEDSSGGVRVLRDSPSLDVPEPGRNVEVLGVTDMGPFAPFVRASRIHRISDLIVPEATPVSLEHALTGVEEDNWVEMRGFVRRVRQQEGWENLEVVTPTGDFFAVLPAGTDVSALLGAVIRARGVCTADTNGQRKLTRIRLWVPSADYIQVEEKPQKDPFDVPARSLSSLGQFNSAQSFNRLLLVSGVVLYQSPGRFTYIEDGGRSLLLFSEDKELLQPGDRIEAAGLLERLGGRVTLREAIYRKTGHGEQPRPTSIAVDFMPSTDFDGRLVNVEGTLIDYSEIGDQFHLTLQNEKVIFNAFLDRTATPKISPAFTSGSFLSLTGVYEVKYDEFGQSSAYQIDLRTPGDIAVLRRSSWLTRERILAFTCALGLGFILFTTWVAALKRQVSKQTRQIQETLRQSDRANRELVRLEHDVRILSERRRELLEIQRELVSMVSHEFRTPLTTIQGAQFLLEKLLTEPAGLSRSVAENVEKWLKLQASGLKTLNNLVDQVLVLNRIDHMTGEASLKQLSPVIVLEETVAQFNDSMDSPRVVLHNEVPIGFTASMDSRLVKAAAENLISNSLKYSELDKLVQLRVYTEPDGWAVEVVDQGMGIPQEDQAKLFQPFFRASNVATVPGTGLGLTIVKRAVDFHTGRVEFESRKNAGTSFRLYFPLLPKLSGVELSLLANPRNCPTEPRKAGDIGSQSRMA